MKRPKDLGVKFGSKDEVFWTNVKGMTEMQLKHFEGELREIKIKLEDLEKSIKFNKGIIEHADNRIAEEKETFK